MASAEGPEIGSLRDLYFDDHSWTVRYLVVDTGGWLSGREVLISPVAAGRLDPEAKTLPVQLTKAQIESSPSVDTALPVSRQMEAQMATYYGWPLYWGLVPPPGEAIPPAYAAAAAAQRVEDPEPRTEPQLRSVKEVTGYTIQATDAQVGHVEDFLVEDESWKLRYLVVDARDKVLLAPLWVERISWRERAVRVDVASELIRTAPAFDKLSQVNRQYERALFSHYNRA